MMLGQIFLVTLVAGLVSLWRPGEALLARERAASSGERQLVGELDALDRLRLERPVGGVGRVDSIASTVVHPVD
jgi:hypothetical protein